MPFSNLSDAIKSDPVRAQRLADEVLRLRREVGRIDTVIHPQRCWACNYTIPAGSNFKG